MCTHAVACKPTAAWGRQAWLGGSLALYKALRQVEVHKQLVCASRGIVAGFLMVSL